MDTEEQGAAREKLTGVEVSAVVPNKVALMKAYCEESSENPNNFANVPPNLGPI